MSFFIPGRSRLSGRDGADEIVTAGESGGKAMSRIYGNIGFRGLWNGLPIRIAMIGTLTAFQWLIYDSFKVHSSSNHRTAASPLTRQLGFIRSTDHWRSLIVYVI